MLPFPESILSRLKDFQNTVRTHLINARHQKDLHAIDRLSTADTIYAIDAVVDPLLDAFCQDWSKETSLVLIAEGLGSEDGGEVEGPRVYPHGITEKDAEIRLIVDPIDG